MTTIEKPTTAVDPAHDEVVTVAHHRLVHLRSPGHPTGVTVSLITLDNGRNQQRPNTFGPQGLNSLDTAITAAIESRPDAIAITGKPGSFAAGADLSQLVGIDRAAADDFASLGHRVFGRLRDAPVPTFALINAWAVAWNWRCTATTASWPPTRRHFRYLRCPWASCRVGVERNSCPGSPDLRQL